ncbi:MAG: hypothetical protein R3313_02760 [Candidatus Saccharimonadales bacterium]|nr:hypothetical protein [Candidatus Saccharimonadales bacterium]
MATEERVTGMGGQELSIEDQIVLHENLLDRIDELTDGAMGAFLPLAGKVSLGAVLSEHLEYFEESLNNSFPAKWNSNEELTRGVDAYRDDDVDATLLDFEGSIYDLEQLVVLLEEEAWRLDQQDSKDA